MLRLKRALNASARDCRVQQEYGKMVNHAASHKR